MKFTGHLLAPLLALSLLTGCASSKSKPNEKMPTPEEADSSIEISYVLGHNRYKFCAASQENVATGQTFMEREKLQDSRIDTAKYTAFLKKVAEFSTTSQRVPASFCRSPFTVSFRIGKRKETLSGCRTGNEAALSKIIQEGEFLLYSKK
ncbi:hypothetical protein WDW86_04030 [Bdellovibrionota bacterium FG-2]